MTAWTRATDAERRDNLGRIVRAAWIEWALEQPDRLEHHNWLVVWDDLPERDREVDRRIGEAVLAARAESVGAPPVGQDARRHQLDLLWEDHDAARIDAWNASQRGDNISADHYDREAERIANEIEAVARGGGDARLREVLYSDTSINGVRQTWQELAERGRDENRELQAYRSILSDLSRCEHGRHLGDVCSECGGPSEGNTIIPPGTVIGHDIGGRAIIVPAKAQFSSATDWRASDTTPTEAPHGT